MTWTYTSPSSSNRDAVRFLATDTVSSDPLLSNEEIDWLLTTYGSVNAATVAACRQISRQFARAATSKQVGDLQIDWLKRSSDFAARADELEADIYSSARPYAGGIYVADRDAMEADATLIQPFFRRGMHDNPGVGHLDTSST